jgi:hypothetical protein
MATRSTPNPLNSSIASLGALGTGAVLHLCAGVSPAMAVALTAVAAVPAILSTIAWAVITITRAISEAQIRSAVISAVIKGELEAKDATLLLSEDIRVSATLEERGTGKERAGEARPRRLWHTLRH